MAANVSLSPVPDWSDVLRIGLALTGVEESTSYRQPCLKLRRTFVNMSPRAGALVVHIPLEEQPLASRSADVYFVRRTTRATAASCCGSRVDEDELAGDRGRLEYAAPSAR